MIVSIEASINGAFINGTAPGTVIGTVSGGGLGWTLADGNALSWACTPSPCFAVGYSAYVYYAIASAPIASLTVSGSWFENNPWRGTNLIINVQGLDVSNAQGNIKDTFNYCAPTCSSTAISPGTLTINGNSFAVAALSAGFGCSNLAGSTMNKNCQSVPFNGPGIQGYSVVASTGSYGFGMTSPNPGDNWLDVGVDFDAVPLGRFTCSVTNLQAGNYVVAETGGPYDFRCTVDSDGITAINAAISDVRIEFNDSLHFVKAEYVNGTGPTANSEFILTNGSEVATLSNSGTVTSSVAAGVRTLVVNFIFTFNAGTLVDSSNRGIYLFALNNNFVSRGYEYLGNSFNTLNRGGALTASASGACSIPAAADTFQTTCKYGSNSHNWIAENATYYQLQMYQAQFAIQLTNVSNSAQVGYFWQNYGNSGSGTNPSTNKGDWEVQYGLYYYDNSTWVKGISVKLSMFDGRVGSSNLWTGITALWYNGNTLIENDTTYNFVPSETLSQVNFWVNLWYSQNNASTSEGGQIGSYYTGMHNTGYLIWTSWSPFLANQTQSQVFTPLYDHTHKVMSAQNAQFTKVFMNMSRPGAPLANAKQYNFYVTTLAYKEQEFNTASSGMGGITTPTFATAIVPTIASGSIFSPIINAIKSIASFFAKSLLSLGNYVWAAIGSQFPWFTNFWSSVGTGVVKFALTLGKIFVYILDGLNVVLIGLGYVTYPIQVIVGAVGWIQGLFSWLGPVTGASAQEFIIVLVVLYFVADIMNAAEKGDTAHFIRLASGAWRIAEAIMWWTYLFVKFIIDTFEGLIP